jgi:hypothetical protein
MLFEVAGPFDLTRHGSKNFITDETLKNLKLRLEDWAEGLSGACGCYVFAVRAGKGYTPYYIGQACKSSIAAESLNPSNREKYNKVLSESKGTPVLFTLPLRTPTGKFRKRSQVNGGLAELDFLEGWLIANAIEKNAALINNKRTKFLRQIHVAGFFNAKKGESTSASQQLRKTIWS